MAWRSATAVTRCAGRIIPSLPSLARPLLSTGTPALPAGIARTIAGRVAGSWPLRRTGSRLLALPLLGTRIVSVSWRLASPPLRPAAVALRRLASGPVPVPRLAVARPLLRPLPASAPFPARGAILILRSRIAPVPGLVSRAVAALWHPTCPRPRCLARPGLSGGVVAFAVAGPGSLPRLAVAAIPRLAPVASPLLRRGTGWLPSIVGRTVSALRSRARPVRLSGPSPLLLSRTPALPALTTWTVPVLRPRARPLLLSACLPALTTRIVAAMRLRPRT